ncbi:hypothetical protein BYT27DRAFT_6496710 [Phlegmacium glaucopus]|nr:hypothetical protein BYT27DRAFT_6496710 [Phlegmacium glaucopus]
MRYSNWKAIEFLEAGRSIFWSQSLSLRSPFDQLHDIKPQLARKLRGIATALELGSYRDISVDISDNRKKLSLDQEASRLNRLNEEWEKGINEVRKLKGFEDFLRPSPFSLLQKAASAYPVVILVANDKGSHCLILTSTSIHHIDIPSLPTSGMQDFVRLVQAAASQMTISRSSIDTIMGGVTALLGETRGLRLRDNQLRSSDDIFKFVLRILWDEVVKPVVSLLKIDVSTFIHYELSAYLHDHRNPIHENCPCCNGAPLEPSLSFLSMQGWLLRYRSIQRMCFRLFHLFLYTDHRLVAYP